MLAMTDSNSLASSCFRPDLDWSQVRETVLMLSVAVAQIDRAMGDGDRSVDTLTNSFVALVDHINGMDQLLAKLSDSNDKAELQKISGEVTRQIQASIVAFQFYDTLQQRLHHASAMLGQLSELVNSPQRLYNPGEWKSLQEQIRSRYTLVTDVKAFDQMVNGVSSDDVTPINGAMNHDEVELF